MTTDYTMPRLDEDYILDQTSEDSEESFKMVKVINCHQLNVRVAPDNKAEILCLVNKGAQLMMVSDRRDDSDWAYVFTDAGIEGFVMRNFIKEL